MYSKKEWLKALIHGFVCGIAFVVFICLVLRFIRTADPELLGLVVR